MSVLSKFIGVLFRGVFPGLNVFSILALDYGCFEILRQYESWGPHTLAPVSYGMVVTLLVFSNFCAGYILLKGRNTERGTLIVYSLEFILISAAIMVLMGPLLDVVGEMK